MPSGDAILQQLTAIANQWRWLALLWHLGLAALTVAVSIGWRPSKRLFAVLLALPVASVGALAWAAGNPFNGTIFAVLAVTMILVGFNLPRERIAAGSSAQGAVGMLLVAFGWAYPEFLDAGSWMSYLYAAPFGLVPCPTLSVLAGASLIFGSLGSRAWAVTISLAALAYGLLGVFALGVAIDVVLIAGAAVLSATTVMTERHRASTGGSRPPAAIIPANRAREL